MSRLPYNIHASINYKSWRKGLVNDRSLLFNQLADYLRVNGHDYIGIKFDPVLVATEMPRNGYGIYYPNVWGKTHSNYPKF